MADDNSTTAIQEKLSDNELSKFRAIRRSAFAIRACAEILNEHEASNGSIPGKPCVFIHLSPNQACGLEFAIEACACRITDIFDTAEFENIGFLDDFSPVVTREAGLVAELQSGTINYEEFRRELSK